MDSCKGSTAFCALLIASVYTKCYRNSTSKINDDDDNDDDSCTSNIQAAYNSNACYTAALRDSAFGSLLITN